MVPPLVSICIPAFNAEKTLVSTLASLQAQSHRNLEIYVVDDASTDRTPEIARSFGRQVGVLRNEVNVGLRANWERCMRLGTGKYRAIYHADDVYEPTMVARQVAFLEQHAEVGLVFTSALLIDEGAKVIGRSKEFRQLGLGDADHATFALPELLSMILRHDNFLVAPSAMARSRVHDEMEQWGSDVSLGAAADLDVWLQIAKRHKVALLADRLIRYRCSRNQHSYRHNRLRTERAEYLRVIDRWLEDADARRCVTGEDLKCKRELERRDRIECAARALLLDQKDLAVKLLEDAKRLREDVRSATSLKFQALAYATQVAHWPGMASLCKPIIAQALSRRRAW